MKKLALALALWLLPVSALAQTVTAGGGQNGAAGQAAIQSDLIGCIVNQAATGQTGQQMALSCTSTGQLNISGTISATNPSVATTGAAVPTSATNIGAKNGSNLVQLQADASSFLDVNCQVGCAGGSFNNNTDAVATSATNGQSAVWLYAWNGATWDRLTDDASKNLDVKINVALPAGTNVIGHVIVDTAPTTAVTCAACALETGGNLATLAGAVNASAMVVKQATAANLNMTEASAASILTQVTTTATNSGTIAGAVASSVMQDNIKQANGVTILMGAGATGTGSLRTTVAQDTTTIAGSAVGTAGTASANVVSVQGEASMTPVLVTNIPATSGGASHFSAIVAANTTSVAVKASAGQLYGISAFNNSATIAYLKLYDASQGSTTCGSGTPVERLMIPASGGFVKEITQGDAFATAITYAAIAPLMPVIP
jgi:hypothetical protein